MNESGLPWMVFTSLLLVACLVFAASVSFRREASEGVLELLLVTPLRPASILWARMRSLWQDFFPALALSSLCVITAGHRFIEGAIVLHFPIWTTFFTAPFVAARFSIRRINVVSSWLWTVGLIIILPLVAGYLLAFLTSSIPDWNLIFIASFATAQILMAKFATHTTIVDIESRRFQMKPLQKVPG